MIEMNQIITTQVGCILNNVTTKRNKSNNANVTLLSLETRACSIALYGL